MLGFPILYLKGMGIMMFQLSGFCYRVYGFRALGFGFFLSSFLCLPNRLGLHKARRASGLGLKGLFLEISNPVNTALGILGRRSLEF